MLLAGCSLTPPGRTASAWVGDLVGIGEVGGSPTRDPGGFPKTNAPIVVDNGHAPDGTRYEWVAYGCKVDLTDDGQPTRFRGFGTSLTWPGIRGGETSGSCEGPRGPSERPPLLGGYGVEVVPSQVKGVRSPDLAISGTTGGERAHSVRVLVGARGHDLPVDFARVDERLRRRAGVSQPLGTFTAFVPGKLAAQERLTACLSLAGRVPEPPRGVRRSEVCDRRHPQMAAFRRRLGRCAREHPFSMRRRFRCTGRAPRLLQVVVYDAAGRELGRQSYPLAVRTPTPVVRRPERRRRSRFPHHEGTIGKPTVLAGGRAPDGSRYEFVVDRQGRRGRAIGSCLTLFWPYVPGAGAAGFCPGPTARCAEKACRARAARVFAKAFGFLDTELAGHHPSWFGARPSREHAGRRACAARLRTRVRERAQGRARPARASQGRTAPPPALARGVSDSWVSFLPRAIGRRYRGSAGRAIGDAGDRDRRLRPRRQRSWAAVKHRELTPIHGSGAIVGRA